MNPRHVQFRDYLREAESNWQWGQIDKIVEHLRDFEQLERGLPSKWIMPDEAMNVVCEAAQHESLRNQQRAALMETVLVYWLGHNVAALVELLGALTTAGENET